MQREFEVKTPSLAASTELLVMAPIKPGLVPTLDTVTYKTRVKTLLRTLHNGRQSQHEYRLLRAMSDAVERVGVIRSLRVNVVEGAREEDDKILLSVHFDGSYEAYVRTIWQKAARLLDLIFCNTVNYPTGWTHSFDDWNRWIRSVQVTTPFFYATPGITYPDQTYLLMLERRDRGGPGDALERTRIAVPSAEEIAWQITENQFDPTKQSQATGPSSKLPLREVIRQNLGALYGICGFADWYRPGTPDGDVLLAAAHELLPQLADIFAADPNLTLTLQVAGGAQLARPLAWFQMGLGAVPAARTPPRLPDRAPQPDPPGDVQGGILQPDDGVSDGLLCLLGFEDSAAAAGFLESFDAGRAAADGQALAADAVRGNFALTLNGLRACGMAESQLERWPLEFRQGMAARAGLLGDVRWNHPRRWVTPRLNWPRAADPGYNDSQDPALALESVHAVAQFRVCAADDQALAPKRLVEAVQARLLGLAGVSLLSVQWLRRQIRDGNIVDHFGYADGQSQPAYEPNPAATRTYSNQVQLGEVLVGHDNAADHADDLDVNQDPELRALMRNGSFLVVRKLRQNVAAFRKSVARAADQHGLDEVEIRARMAGRWPLDAGARAGGPLTEQGGGGINDFDYRGDPRGDQCPLGAHARRANPRDQVLPGDFPKQPPGGRPPRLVRCGMSYGPFEAESNDPKADRGLVFMAYNASPAQQFEVIQGWLAGGNSAGGYSGTACPLLGVPELGRERNFRFAADGATVHMPVDGSADLGIEPEPLVTLQWGLYAFAPSRSAQALLAALARKAGPAAGLPWSVDRGQALIERLRRVEAESGAAAGAQAWKAALEDPESLARFDSASLWAAVRELHGGVLRIPYGVLVGTPELVDAVLSDEARYSVSGYRQRLVNAGMGPIFLGRDAADPEYARLSKACNAAIEQVTVQDGFDAARAAAREVLDGYIDRAIQNAQAVDETEWEVSFDARDLVCATLATLCEQWFGIDDSTTGASMAAAALFARGGMDWSWRPGAPVRYPGHFTAASRATFQPEPTEAVLHIATEHGQALTGALLAFIQAKTPAAITAPISRPVLDDLWATRPQDAVHTIAGAMMGFLPTTEGELRRVLAEWTRDGTLLDLAARSGGPGALQAWPAARELIDGPLRRAMKFRPVPEQIWRTARVAHRLGAGPGPGVAVQAGDKLIVGQVSATQAQLAQGEPHDVFAVFGGRRPSDPAQAPAPTHACPGYKAAMGAMVGLLSAVLDHPLATPGPSPAAGVLYFSGQTGGELRQSKGKSIESVSAFRALDTVGQTEDLPGQGQVLMAFGDSWMRFQAAPKPGYDFMRALQDLGYDTSSFVAYAAQGALLNDMSKADPQDGKTIYGALRRAVAAKQALPLAVLLDGGGNDFTAGETHPLDCSKSGLHSPLDQSLCDKGTLPPIDGLALGRFLGNMTDCLGYIVRELAKASSGRVPVIVVAYDHPFPDGKPFGLLCPWLAPTFTRKHFDPPNKRQCDPAAATLMATFIDRLNDAYGTLIDALRKDEGIDVRLVRLTGVLASTAAFQQGGHQAVWYNELHPNVVGYTALAKYLHDQALQGLIAAAAQPTH
jgi:deferrochelatase/peroxidase EfeB